ncbi:TerD family protein [Nocardia takedensis]|uniref:TerD family protein n=1 Tax=Nocardia takedensis TaxID=259390 RepID=UPI000A073DFA|nr:TerD family protein [Nocardia takedensis]
MELSKGANAAVPTSLLAVVVSWRSAHVVDAHALLLTGADRVRSDRDLVFFNAPRHISQAVTLDQEPDSGTARLSVSLPRTEAEIERIVLGGSLEDGSFEAVEDLTVTVLDARGPVARYAVTDTDRVDAMMFGEFYRRDGQWRFRAIGQGWASGLAGLVTEFGVQVDEQPNRSSRASNPFARPGRTDSYPVGSHPRLDDTAVDPRGDGHDIERRTEATAVNPRRDGPDTERRAEATTVNPRGDLPEFERRTDATAVNRRAEDGHDIERRTEDTSVDRPAGGGTAAREESTRRDEPCRAPGSVTPSAVTRPLDLTRRTLPQAPPPPPPDPARADWYRDQHDPGLLRWWDGTRWTDSTHRPAPAQARLCALCGQPLRRRLFGGVGECRPCAENTEQFLTHWQNRAARVLAVDGPSGPEWERLWASLRFQRIPADAGRALLHEAGTAFVERLATFAFADGAIAQEEYDTFEHAVAELALGGPLIDDLRRRLHRGRTLSRLREGELPAVRTPGLHLDPEERVHLDLPATHVRELARGPRRTEGRLIASNRKLRFVGSGAGTEMPWSRVVSVHAEGDAVVIAATSARGGAVFEVDDPDYVAAAVEGALRVAKRLVLTPGRLDSRSIPQEVKAEVWQRDGGRCVECGSGHYLEFDHVIPHSRGGATSPSNLQILCRSCNRAKGARI